MLEAQQNPVQSERVQLADRSIEGLLIDIDGVLYVGNQALPGAVLAIQRLRVPHLFLTNTTTQSTRSLVQRLHSLGFPTTTEQVLTAPTAAKQYLEQRGSPPCKLLLAPDVLADFADYPQSDSNARAVVVGDIGNAWTYDLLNEVFRLMLNGAELIALHKNKFWQTADGLSLDIGAFIAGLEYVTGQTATIMGKPSHAFFQAALSRLGLEAATVAMVGDDIDSDVGGAQAQGLLGVLVQTGKYRAEYAASSSVRPDLILPSIADL